MKISILKLALFPAALFCLAALGGCAASPAPGVATAATPVATPRPIKAAKLGVPRYHIVDLGSLQESQNADVKGGVINATDMNNRGQVVGVAFVSDGSQGSSKSVPFIYENGKMSALELVPGSEGGWAIAINEKGEVLGWIEMAGSTDPKDIESRSRNFKWFQGKMTLLDTYQARRTVNGKGEKLDQIRVKGDVTRDMALYRGGRAFPLPGIFTQAIAINDKSQVVGTSLFDPKQVKGAVAAGKDAPNDHPDHPEKTNGAFLWNGGGKLQCLGTLPGTTDSIATDINEKSQVVGKTHYRDKFPPKSGHSFLWQNGKMYDLNDLIEIPAPTESSPPPEHPISPNWVLDNAMAINDSGQIAGWGTSEGQTRAFLMTPVK